MSTIWIDCPTDSMTVSPPFCIRGGFLTDHGPLTLQVEIFCPGHDPTVLQQTVATGLVRSTTAAITPFCFKITAAPECVVTITVSLLSSGGGTGPSSGPVEECSSTVYDISIVPVGGSDCQCPADCPSGNPPGPTTTPTAV